MNTASGSSTARRRAVRVLASFFVAYALLVSTHLGEFWPFSIYPMFSSAGNPWTRAIAHEIPPEVEGEALWTSAPIDELPGAVFPLSRHGIFQNDLANYASKTEQWTRQRVDGLAAMFRGRIEQDERVMIYLVTGDLKDDGVDITAAPLILIQGSEATLAPAFAPAEGSHD